jgi:hypothetical protein
LTFALLSVAVAKPKTGARTAMDGAQNYSCVDYCFDRYNTCRVSGTSATVCQRNLQTCYMYCMGSSTAAAPQESVE